MKICPTSLILYEVLNASSRRQICSFFGFISKKSFMKTNTEFESIWFFFGLELEAMVFENISRCPNEIREIELTVTHLKPLFTEIIT